MMKGRGHEVVHLGNETSHPVADENVAVTSYEQWRSVYDHPGTNFFDITVETPERQEFHRLFADNMRRVLEERIGDQHDAIICVTWGGPQHEATNSVKRSAFVVESGIGYKYPTADYRVFESYWGEDKDISKDDVLRDIVEEVRLDADEYFDKINRQEYKDRVRINTDEVMARGGYGTPTIFVNGSMFFGNDRIVLVEEELRREKKG